MHELSGKSAFVTGGAGGIGFAIASNLAQNGVAVAVADINGAAAIEACERIEAAGGRAVPIACDVTDEKLLEASADEAHERLGPIQILVNNAGAFTAGALEESRSQDWHWLLEINVLGVVNGLRTFLPRMHALDAPAHVVNTASVSGHIPVAGLSIYTATKFAVVGLSECLRLELADTPIDVSVLCPGIVKTGLLESSRKHRAEKHGSDSGGAESPMAAVIETGSDPDEVGQAVVTAVRNGDFYILTHSNLQPAFQKRFDEILGAFTR